MRAQTPGQVRDRQFGHAGESFAQKFVERFLHAGNPTPETDDFRRTNKHTGPWRFDTFASQRLKQGLGQLLGECVDRLTRDLSWQIHRPMGKCQISQIKRHRRRRIRIRARARLSHPHPTRSVLHRHSPTVGKLGDEHILKAGLAGDEHAPSTDTRPSGATRNSPVPATGCREGPR